MARLIDRFSPVTAKSPLAMKRQWDKMCEQVEGAYADLATQVAAIAAAQAAADAAALAASTAQSTANTVKRDDKITGSSVIPANVLTGQANGAAAKIVIAAHTRIYGDGSQVSVAGGTLTDCAYNTTYGIYYDDTTASTTSPSYQKTTTLSNALNGFVVGRHFVGNVTTPATSGSADTTGGYSPPATGADDFTSRGDYGGL